MRNIKIFYYVNINESKKVIGVFVKFISGWEINNIGNNC